MLRTSRIRSSLGGLLALVLVLGAASALVAQPPAVPYNMKFHSGQNVQPAFEGWSINDDGSFAMHFGYLNRNWVEQVHVPVGPDNRFEGGSGEIDVGQPTLFYPRAHRRVFSVTVPSTFGIDERLNWLLTVRGETLQASGWLQPEWETAADNQGIRRLSEEALQNVAPTIAVDTPSGVTVQSGATLTARVADDGLPVVQERVDLPGSNDPPTLVKPDTELDAPNNVPGMPNGRRRGGGGGGGGGVRGLRVSWIVWRGPAGVTFEPGSPTAVENGQAVVTATFTTPGEYVLRAEANDNLEQVELDVPVTVR